MLAPIVTLGADLTTWNPNSNQDNIANLQAAIYIVKNNLFDQDAEVWQTGLLPEKKIIFYKGSYYYNVRSYKNCAFGWPVSRNGDAIELDMTIRTYTTIVIFSLDEVQILPFALQSPIMLYALGSHGSRCKFMASGALESVLEHHIINGFRNLGEAILKRMFDDMELVMPAGVEKEEQNPKDDYRMMMMLTLDPSLTEEQALDRLLAENDLDEDCADDGLLDIDRDLVVDGIEPKDLVKFEDEQAKQMAQEDNKSKRDGVSKRVKKLKQSYAKIKPCIDPDWVKAKKHKAPTAKALAKKKARIYEGLDKSKDKALRDHMPPKSAVFTDEKNGRWRIAYQGTTHSRSVSWTVVGQQVAFGVALDQLWSWAFEASALEAPDEVKSVLQDMGLYTGP